MRKSSNGNLMGWIVLIGLLFLGLATSNRDYSKYDEPVVEETVEESFVESGVDEEDYSE